ncbi:MAG TPA: DNA internalization-related competence protein ComEC/Rec2 [Ignavibacteria bacterium]
MQNKKYFLFFTSLFFIVGIYFGYNIVIPKITLLVFFLITLLFCILGFSLKTHSSEKTFFFFTSIFLLGIIKIQLDIKENNSSQNIFFKTNEDLITSGVITQKPVIKKNNISFLLNIDRVFLYNKNFKVNFNVIAKIYIDSLINQKEIKYGDRILSVGKLIEPSTQKNPGEFNYKKYLDLNDIDGFYKIQNFKFVIIQSEDNGIFYEQKIFQPLRSFIASSIDNSHGKVESAFLKGLLVGDRTDIPEELKENFLNAGVMHVLAVSGLNVAFVILIFSSLYSIFIHNKKIKMFFLIFSLIFYMILAGSSPSIVRATIMGIIFIVGNNLERKIYSINLLGFSALIILLIDSRELFDLGFQLSFLCVFSLLWLYPILKNLLCVNIKIKTVKIIIDSIIASLSIIIMLAPIIAQTNGKISIISIIANLFVVPLANISLALGFLEILSLPISSFISQIISSLNQTILWLNINITNYFGSSKIAYIEAFFSNSKFIVLYYLTIFIAFISIAIKKYIYAFLIIIFTFNLILWNSIFSNQPNNKLKIYFLSVGQGDATLLQSPNGSNILIDSGPKTENFDSGEKILYPFFQREGIKQIDFCFISHFHDDHYGGLPFLIQKRIVKNIIYNDTIGSYPFFKELSILCNENNVKLKQFNTSTITIDNIKIFNLNSKTNDNYYYDKSSKNISSNSETNNSSMVLKVLYGKNSFLFTGDIEKEKEIELIKKWNNFLDSDILKVAHHGSKSSSENEFLKIVSPQISIIFVGLKNKFHFPSKETINKLVNNNISILRTDIDNAIILESDGINISRILWN